MYDLLHDPIDCLEEVQDFLIVRAWEDEAFRQSLVHSPDSVIREAVVDRTGNEISEYIDFDVVELASYDSSETGAYVAGFDFSDFSTSHKIAFNIPANPNTLLSRQEAKSELAELSSVFACRTSEVSDCDRTETVSCNTSTLWIIKCCKDDD